VIPEFKAQRSKEKWFEINVGNRRSRTFITDFSPIFRRILPSVVTFMYTDKNEYVDNMIVNQAHISLKVTPEGITLTRFPKNWFNPSIETLALLRKPVFFVFICSHQ